MTNREQFLELEKLVKQISIEKAKYFEEQNKILKELIKKKDFVSEEYEKKQKALQNSIHQLQIDIKENSKETSSLKDIVKEHKNRFSIVYMVIWAYAIGSLFMYTAIKGL